MQNGFEKAVGKLVNIEKLEIFARKYLSSEMHPPNSPLLHPVIQICTAPLSEWKKI